jgi:hypothetical protein
VYRSHNGVAAPMQTVECYEVDLLRAIDDAPHLNGSENSGLSGTGFPVPHRSGVGYESGDRSPGPGRSDRDASSTRAPHQCRSALVVGQPLQL